MSDDYLWDGSGEPDPEIEKLERLLGKYRYQPKPVAMPVRPRRFFDRRLAVAAAIILVALAGIWMAGLRDNGPGQPGQEMAGGPTDVPPEAPGAAPAPVPESTPVPKENIEPLQAVNKIKARKVIPESKIDLPEWDIEQAVEESVFPDETSVIAMSQQFNESDPAQETARHIEKAQMLLQAFKNATSEGNSQVFDVEYEKERSRELVFKNIVLRRGAEARNNYPVEEVLASLEPILLDIANLPASPSKEEMRQIVERMQKMEIVATLQVHSGLLAIQNQ
ncbi:MAG TPA: hypothetical protein VFQ92_12640 [Blastocatellia bacterium]|nr:hypothetical protein [Blastocatellia bacterium]